MTSARCRAAVMSAQVSGASDDTLSFAISALPPSVPGPCHVTRSIEKPDVSDPTGRDYANSRLS